MMSAKSWKIVPFAACLSVAVACGATNEGTGMEGVETPAAGAGNGSKAGTPAVGAAGSTAAGSGASAGTTGAAAGTTAGGAGTGAAGTTTAVAMIAPFMGGGTSSGAAGASGAAGTGSSTAGASAAAGAGGASSGSAGSGGAGGSGAGAGLAAISGTATFTNMGGAQVDVAIDITGCEDGKSYPVHIHEGTSCESAATQGAHWGAPQSLQLGAAGAAGDAAAAGAGGGAAAAGAGAAGHDAGHAGSGGSAAGAGAAGAGGPATSFQYRGEGIPDIKCTGTTGNTSAKRNSFDKRVTWSIGTMSESDVVGHVVVVHDGAARIGCGKIELK
jgi:hypothetical protein